MKITYIHIHYCINRRAVRFVLLCYVQIVSPDKRYGFVYDTLVRPAV